MHLRTGVSLGTLFAASAAAATLIAWQVGRDRPAPPPARNRAPAPAAQAPQPVTTPPVPAPVDDSAEPPVPTAAKAGDVDVAWLPKGYVQKLPAARTAELIAFVNAWLGGSGEAPAIEYRKGAVFVQSREDRGDDGPYPRSAEPEGQRVCGTQARWMREALEARARADESLVCAQNVCWYGGMEYAPSGYLVFREYTTTYGDQTWALDAWIEVYDCGLTENTAAANQADVERMMKRLASTSCPGEPAGSY